MYSFGHKTQYVSFSSSTVLTCMLSNQGRLEVHPHPRNQLHTISVCDRSVYSGAQGNTRQPSLASATTHVHKRAQVRAIL